MMRRPLACAALAALLAGCAGPVHHGPRVGMVLDVGGLGDRSFNDSAYVGLGRCVVLDDAEPRALQAGSESDYPSMLADLAAAKENVAIGIGYLMQDAVAAAARANPATRFALVDAVVDAPNVTSITFREEEGAFLAGAVAALTSRTHHVAFIGGIDSPLLRTFEAGYTAGARHARPGTRVDVRYLGSFDDLQAAARTTGTLFDGGADVVFAAAGRSGLGAIGEAKRRKRWAIGVDADQDGLAPGTVLTSMRTRIDVAVERVCRDTDARRPAGGHVVLGLAEDAVGLTDFRYTRGIVGEPALKEVARLRAAIVAHQITVPSTRDQVR